jgi:hypothetical protein
LIDKEKTTEAPTKGCHPGYIMCNDECVKGSDCSSANVTVIIPTTSPGKSFSFQLNRFKLQRSPRIIIIIISLVPTAGAQAWISHKKNV